MATTLIDIAKYTKKFQAYPPDLVEFAKSNGVSLPPLTSLRGQALALMSQPEVRGRQHITRNEAVKFFENIRMETTDAIQQFNKATGIERTKGRGSYCLEYPFVCDMTDIDKRKGVFISDERDATINSIKEWWKKNLVDVPNGEWQIGHLDPSISDSSDKNLAFQPPIQGKYRDRFKFDKNFMKMWPTASELIPKMHEYYTEKEQRLVFEALRKKFDD
jgi:hypothetical protein